MIMEMRFKKFFVLHLESVHKKTPRTVLRLPGWEIGSTPACSRKILFSRVQG
jgi:hypothetical protein